jgi:hypothetical protein
MCYIYLQSLYNLTFLEHYQLFKFIYLNRSFINEYVAKKSTYEYI